MPRTIKRIETLLRIARLDFHSSHGQQRIQVFTVGQQHLAVVGTGLVQIVRVLVEAAQREQHIQIIGETLRQILVGRHRLRVVLSHAGEASFNEILLCQRKTLAEFHRAPRRLLRIGIVTQSGVGLAESRICDSK